jgi:hypothetical protein
MTLPADISNQVHQRTDFACEFCGVNAPSIRVTATLDSCPVFLPRVTLPEPVTLLLSLLLCGAL